MGSMRGDSSWRSDSQSGRRRGRIGSGQLTRGNVLLLLLINALVSLFISIIVFFVFSRIMGYGRAPTLLEQSALATTTPVVSLTRDVSSIQPSTELSADQEEPGVYVVRTGDNLSLIAVKLGVTMEELMAANGIENPDWIGVGQKLVIPNPGGPSPTSTVPPVPTLTETPLPFDPPTPIFTESPTPTSRPEETRGAATAPPPPTPVSGDTPSPPDRDVSIDDIRGIGNLAAEEIVIVITGQVVDLEGWTLDDSDGNTFTLPSVVLWSGAELRIHSAEGSDTPTDLYWNSTESVWDNSQEVATLRNAEGQIMATYRPK
jgi:LysM repeat protein